MKTIPQEMNFEQVMLSGILCFIAHQLLVRDIDPSFDYHADQFMDTPAD